MKQLSIIIPAYNVSEYICQCVDSILASKYLELLDVIIINDGSKDDTLVKVIDYEKKYPKSIRVIDKENGGHGSGINVGVELAEGKYLKVLDSDDWIVKEGLDSLVEFILEDRFSPDIIVNAYEQIWEKTNVTRLHKFDKDVENKLITLKDLNNSKYRFTIHSMTIKTEIYKSCVKTKIDEKTSYDDVQYILYPVPFINSIVYFENVIYQYRMGSSSQSVNIINMQRNRDKLLNIIKNSHQYYINNCNLMNNEQKEYYLRDLGCTVSDYLNLLFTIGDYKTARKEFNKFFEQVDFPLKYIVSKKAIFSRVTKGIFWNLISNWNQRKIKE